MKKPGETLPDTLSTLRGTGVFLVFISHLHINTSKNLLFIFGRTGVVIFFLISGYLTYKSRAKRNAKQYLLNRFMRMYPIYWVVLLPSWLVYDWGELSVPKLLANLTLFQEFLGFDNVIGASWMMPIQICFFVFAGGGSVEICDKER